LDLNNHSSTIGVVLSNGIAVWMAREIEIMGAHFERINVRHRENHTCD
jgi:hypothetical protein